MPLFSQQIRRRGKHNSRIQDLNSSTEEADEKLEEVLETTTAGDKSNGGLKSYLENTQ